MRIVFLIGMLAALSGCGSYRDVTFIYYPNAPPSPTFPPRYQFDALAKSGMRKIRHEGGAYLGQHLGF